jgi:hypothetical protein
MKINKDKFDSNGAAKWLEKAEKAYPYDKQVIAFKERLFSSYELDSQNQNWEEFLLKGSITFSKLNFYHKYNSSHL